MVQVRIKWVRVPISSVLCYSLSLVLTHLNLYLFFVYIVDFRLNATVYMTTVATHWINCAKECVEEPCCRSINFKKIISTQNERNCEMLHNVVYNSSNKKFLLENTSYDYIYFNHPRKVRIYAVLNSYFILKSFINCKFLQINNDPVYIFKKRIAVRA